MLINLTLELSDDLRRVMAHAPDVQCTAEGLITRESAIVLIRRLVSEWTLNASGFVNPKEITPQELADYEDAIAYLRAIGRTDLQIKRWMFKQRARRDALIKLLSRDRAAHV